MCLGFGYKGTSEGLAQSMALNISPLSHPQPVSMWVVAIFSPCTGKRTYWFQLAPSWNKCKGSYSFCCLTRHKEVCSVCWFPLLTSNDQCDTTEGGGERIREQWVLVSQYQPAPAYLCVSSIEHGGQLPSEVACLLDKMNHPVLQMKFTSSPHAEDYNWALVISLNYSWSTLSLQEEWTMSRKASSFFATYNKNVPGSSNKSRKTNHSLRANNKNSCRVLHQPSTMLRSCLIPFSPPKPLVRPLLSSPFYKWKLHTASQMAKPKFQPGLSVPKACVLNH